MLGFIRQAGPAQKGRPSRRQGMTRACGAAAAAAAAHPQQRGDVHGHPRRGVVVFSLCWEGLENPAQSEPRTGIQIVEPGSSNHV